MEYLVDLFQKTYKSQSSSEIAEATKIIQSQYPNQLFYQTCLQIIFDQENQISVVCKKSALNAFAKGIEKCWKDVFDDNLKSYLLSQIPELLAHTPIELLALCEKLSDKITEFSLFEDNCPYLFEIIPQLFQNDINYLRAGLIISKSVCKKIKIPNNEMAQAYSSFASLISPLLATLCKECDDYILLNFCYHCLSRLLINPNEITEQIVHNYGEIYYGKFMSLAMSPPEKIDGNFPYIKFLIEGIKFLKRISDKLDNEQIENIIRFIQIVFQIPTNKNISIVKAKAIGLLNSMIIKNKRYDILESHMQLIMEIIFSQLMLSDEDIENMENDPEAFIQANPQANINWEDDKASCCHFVLNCIKKIKSNVLIEFVYQIASSSLLQSGSRNQIFTSFRLLTNAVSKKCKVYFDRFLPYLIEAFDHPDFVIRTGAFYLLSTVQCCNITQQLINSCISHLNDQAPIVRYYAALALSQSFYFCRRQKEYQQFKELYSSHISDIYTSLIEVSSQFNDSYISDTFSQFVCFFDEQVLPFSIPLFDKIIEAFVKSCTSEDSDFSQIEETSAIALNSIIKIVGKSIKANPDSLNELYGHFYSKLCSAIEATAGCPNVSRLFPLLSSLIDLSPVFMPVFWELLEPLMVITSNGIIDIDESAPVVEQLIFKDEELGTREQIVTNLCTILLTSGALISVPTFCSSLIMRIGSSIPCINEILASIKSEASNSDEKSGIELESICNIVSAIFLNFDDFSGLFDGGDMTLFNIWVSQHNFPFFTASLLKIFGKFNEEIEAQVQMLKSGFLSILTGIYENEEEDELLVGDDDDDDDNDDDLFIDSQANPGDFGLSAFESPKWFNNKELIQQFLQLVNGLIEAQSPVVQAFGPEELFEQMSKFTKYLNY